VAISDCSLTRFTAALNFLDFYHRKLIHTKITCCSKLIRQVFFTCR